ncbi:MAG: HAD-IA family hydrolase [Clostridia bacterium]|nr:HAD-IA family hydrolase [Clostridia bacterium]
MKNIKAVLFDLDGTLLDTLDDLTDAVNATMRVFGYPEHTKAAVRSYVGNGVTRLMELVLPGGAEDENFEEATAVYRRIYAAHSEEKTRPYDGIAECVGTLARCGIKTAVVSNKPDETTVRLTKKWFPEIHAAAGENEAAGIRRKPAPDMVLRAMAALGVTPEETVYVGDSEVDLLTAKNAGLPCISVLWGFRDREELAAAGASVLIGTPQELTELVTEGTGPADARKEHAEDGCRS